MLIFLTSLQKNFLKLGFNKPLCIGCQHHVLNTILKHEMSDYFEGVTTSLISFFGSITEEYEQLKASFENS